MQSAKPNAALAGRSAFTSRRLSASSSPAPLAALRRPFATKPIAHHHAPSGRLSLTSSFLPSMDRSEAPLCAAFSGMSLSGKARDAGTGGRGLALVVRAGKRCLGNTTGGTNRKRRRNSGFRTRMRTPGGRNVIRRRRAKGRKHLCPASETNGKFPSKPPKKQ